MRIYRNNIKCEGVQSIEVKKLLLNNCVLGYCFLYPLKTLVYPKKIRDAFNEEIQDILVRFARPAQFELVERAWFHMLVHNPPETEHEFIGRLQRQASSVL